MHIINTGGTFNKKYDPLKGTLVIEKNNGIIKKILELYPYHSYSLEGIVFKDSLELIDEDRALILQYIQDCDDEHIIIIHGTDTMDQTANYIAPYIKDKVIMITGAMIPFSIDPLEAVSNIALCLGFFKNNPQKGTYICMSGLIEPFDNIYKNKVKGVFEQKTVL